MNVRCQTCQTVFSSDALPDSVPMDGYRCPDCKTILDVNQAGELIEANSDDDAFAEDAD